MFEKFGQLASMLKQLPKLKELKEEMDRLQQRLTQITADGSAGADMVKVKVNGRMEVVAFTLSEDVVRQGDREMLEDLLRAATNQALERVRRLVAEETSRLSSGLGLPTGLPPTPEITE